MNWILFSLICVLTPFIVKGDRWDISSPSEMQNYQYVDVAPVVRKEKQLKKNSLERGPASVVPYDKLEEEIPPPLAAVNKFSIIATNDQFLPKVIRIPLQTDVEISLLTNELESCFVLDDLGIRRGLQKDKVHKIIIPAQSEAKEYRFHCAIQKIEGKIIVEPLRQAQ